MQDAQITPLAIVPGKHTKPRKAATVTTAARVVRLAAQMKAAEAAEKAAQLRQDAIIGRVIREALARNGSALSAAVLPVLAAATLTKSERAEITLLLSLNTAGP